MKIGLAAAAAVLMGAPAMATVWTTDYTFSANFQSGPYSELSGSFTVQSDDAAKATVLSEIDFSIDGYSFSPTGSNVDVSWYGSYVLSTTVQSYWGSTNNPAPYIFFLSYSNVPEIGFGLGFLMYRTPDTHDIYSSSFNLNYTGKPVYAAPPAPEPATWAMMLIGFGAVGAGLRRRRASVRFA